jgi:hypothetical protein
VKKEEQHIDNLFQKLKGDSFVTPQSFMDDLKLRIDARAKLAIRRKFTLWFILMSIVLVGIASIIIYTLPRNTVHQSHKQISLSELTDTENSDSIFVRNQNEKMALLNDSNVSESDEGGSSDKFNKSKEEKYNSANENESNLTGFQHLSNKDGISKKDKNSISQNIESRTETNASTRNSKTIKSKGKDGKVQKAKGALYKTSFATKNKSKLTGGENSKLKNVFSASSREKTNADNELVGIEQGPIEDQKLQASFQPGNSEQNDLNKRDVVLKMKTQQAIANPFNLSLEKNESLVENSNLVPVKSSKKLEINVEAYVGALITSTKYNPIPSANDFKSSPLISPNFGLKTSILHQNIYGSVGVEYFKSGDKSTFSTKTLSQVGIDSILTNIDVDTVWIDSNTFFYDSTFIYQTTPIFDSITNSNKFINQYTWISIPLSFGYRFQVNSWDVIPNVGVNLNFGIAQNSGDYPNAKNQLVKYNALKFNMDIRIQTEVRKNFGKYYVFVSPYFRKNLKPIISNPSLRLTQNNWGLNAGFGVKF